MPAGMKLILRVFSSVFLASATMAEPPEKIEKSRIGIIAATKLVRSLNGGTNQKGPLGPRSMEGRVTNTFGKTPVDLVIDVFWFQLPTRAILKEEHFTATIAPNKEFKFESILEDEKEIYNGVKVEGWLVVVRDGASHSLLAVQSNQPLLQEMARTAGALDKLSRRNRGRE